MTNAHRRRHYQVDTSVKRVAPKKICWEAVIIDNTHEKSSFAQGTLKMLM